ncbi:endonuclease [Mycoplasma sp. Z1473D]
MKKMKTILLSLVGLTAITLPAVAVACNKTEVNDDEAKEKENIAKLIKEQQVTADVNDKANMLASAVTTANVTLSGYNAEMFSSVVNSVEAIQNTVKVAYTLKSIKFNDITANGEVVITGFKEPEAQVNPVTGGGETNPSTDGGDNNPSTGTPKNPGSEKPSPKPVDGKTPTDDGTKPGAGEQPVTGNPTPSDGGKPSTGTGDNPDKNPSTPEPSPVVTPEPTPVVTPQPVSEEQDPELVELGIKNGNNIYEVIPGAVNDAVISALKGKEAVNYLYKSYEIATRRKNGISYLQLKSDIDGSKFQLANADKPTFSPKSGGTYPNGILSYTFDSSTNTLTFTYKFAIKGDNKSYKYTDKVYKSVVQLEKADNISTGEIESHPQPIAQPSTEPVIVPSAKATTYEYTYDPSNKYYASLDGLKGQELLVALNKLQAGKTETGNYKTLPNFYNNTKAFRDKYYENDGTMLDIYSENPYGKDPYNFAIYETNNGGNEGDGMNREHIVPQSWFNKFDIMRNDPIHVWPTDIKVNNRRSNFPHDNVVGSVEYTSRNGSKLGVNNIGQKVFEPIDAFKGDIARAYLYFGITYGNFRTGTEDGSKGHSLIRETSESREVFTEDAPFFTEHYLKTYTDWTAKDPVDPFDVDRNNITSEWTKNHRRNPFIDYPNLAENLYGPNPKPFKNLGVLVKATPIAETN